MQKTFRHEMRLAKAGLFFLAYGALVAAVISARAADWISVGMAAVGVVLVVFYAATMLLLGGWWPLAAAIVPALWALDFALFYESEAVDCYPGCTTYENALGLLLYPFSLLFVTAIGLALVQGIKRRRGPRRERRHRDDHSHPSTP